MSTSHPVGNDPEEQDLYLVNTVEVDPDTGEFAEDESGDPVWRDSGILELG